MLLLTQPRTGLAVGPVSAHCHVQLFICQYPQVLLDRAALKPFITQPGLIVGVAGGAQGDPHLEHTGSAQIYCHRLTGSVRQPPMCRTLHLALLTLMRFTRAHFSSLSRSLRMASHPSGVLTTPLSLVSSSNLLWVHSTPLSMSLMKILKSTGPSTDP